MPGLKKAKSIKRPVAVKVNTKSKTVNAKAKATRTRRRPKKHAKVKSPTTKAKVKAATFSGNAKAKVDAKSKVEVVRDLGNGTYGLVQLVNVTSAKGGNTFCAAKKSALMDPSDSAANRKRINEVFQQEIKTLQAIHAVGSNESWCTQLHFNSDIAEKYFRRLIISGVQKNNLVSYLINYTFVLFFLQISSNRCEIVRRQREGTAAVFFDGVPTNA